MKKNLLGKVFTGVITALTLFVNISCGETPAGFDISNTVNSDKILIQPSISEVTSRSVFPDVTLDKLEFIAFKFSRNNGKSSGTVAVYDNYAAFSGTKIALDIDDPTAAQKTATYDSFEVTAKCGNLLLSGKFIPSGAYKASATAYPVEFNLSYALTDNAFKSGKGNISFAFDYSKDISVKEATAKFYKYESGKLSQNAYNTTGYTSEKSKEDGTHYITYGLTDVPAGIYEMQFDIKAENKDKKTVYATYRNCVYVADGCATVENYTIKDAYWYDKHLVGSVMYSNTSKHLKAEATSDGILLTVKYLDGEPVCDGIGITEEDSKVGINLYNWNYESWGNKNNVVPKAANKEVKVLYPFTKADETYIFSLARQKWSGDDAFWDYSEKVIVKASANGVKFFDDDYYNKLARMSVSASSESYEVKLNYDWRKLFDSNAKFDMLKSTGDIYAGDKSWASDKTVGGFKWVGPRKNVNDNGEINLLSDEGKSVYNNFLNGVAINDPEAIKKIDSLGSYWFNNKIEFRVAGNPVDYFITAVESDVAKKPVEQRITVTYNATEDKNNTLSFSYKKGDMLTLPTPSFQGRQRAFAGWYKTSDYKPESAVTVLDCQEDVALYAKWNLQVNNWNFIYNKTQKDNYFANMRFSEIIKDYNTEIKANSPVHVTLTGKVVSDFAGTLKIDLVDYKNGYENKNEIWLRNEKYSAGDTFKKVVTLTSGTNIDADKAGICLFTFDTRDMLELTDWAVTVDEHPVKLTLVNTVSGEEISSYHAENEDVVLPTDYKSGTFVLNSWYDNSSFTGEKLTSVKAVSNPKAYAKMDVKLSTSVWTDGASGNQQASYRTQITANELRKYANCTLTGWEEGYKLKKGDKLTLKFKGKTAQSFKNLYFQIFDTENSWVSSWGSNPDSLAEKDTSFDFTVTTEISQDEFRTANPELQFGYTYDSKEAAYNNCENVISDWSIAVSLEKKAAAN